MKKTNGLSKRLDQKVKVKKNNENQKLIKRIDLEFGRSSSRRTSSKYSRKNRKDQR